MRLIKQNLSFILIVLLPCILLSYYHSKTNNLLINSEHRTDSVNSANIENTGYAYTSLPSCEIIPNAIYSFKENESQSIHISKIQNQITQLKQTMGVG